MDTYLSYAFVYELVRFGAVGILGVIAYYAIYTPCVLIKKDWYLVWASIAFLILLGVTFPLQKYWTFGNVGGGTENAQLLLFVGQRTCFQVLMMWMLRTLVNKKVHPLPAQILVHALFAMPSFFLTKWIFST